VEIAVTEEGVAALRKLSSSLEDNIRDIRASANELASELVDNQHALGPHAGSIVKLIESVRQEQYHACLPVAELCEKVNNLAAAYQDYLDNDIFGTGNSGGSGGSGGLGGSSSGTASGLPLASSLEKPKTLTRDKNEQLDAGKRAIEDNMDEIAKDMRDKGHSQESIDEKINSEREAAQIELYDDVYGKVPDKCVDTLNRYSEYFTEENWGEMDSSERSDALNTLAMSAAEAFRTEIHGVKYFTGPPGKRGYYCGDGYLYLNDDVLSDPKNRIDAVDTIFHEGRHAFQDRAVLDNISCSIDIKTAGTWRSNMPPNYIRHEVNPARYFTQPIEADAFSFAEYVIKMGGI